MSSEPKEAEDQHNSESEKSDSENAWQRFKDFARAIFAVPPDELKQLPPESEEEKESDGLPKIN